MAMNTARRCHLTLAVTLALLAALALAAPAAAKSGGNAAASAACEGDGYLEWTDSAGNAFRNAGACVSYAAHGGTLVAVVVSPFSISYDAAGTNGFRATLTGAGLQPDSSVDLVLTWGEDTIFVNEVADASGQVTLVASAVCVRAGSPLTAVGATGTPAGGVHAEYALPSPDATICPPPA
jgi:hypothetical protein